MLAMTYISKFRWSRRGRLERNSAPLNVIEGPSRLGEVFSIWTPMIIHLLTAVVNAEVIVPVCEPYDSLYHT